MRADARKLSAVSLVIAGVTTLAAAASSAPAYAASAAAPTATVRASGGLTIRSGPATAYDRVGGLADGARVTIVCSVIGERIAGQVRTTEVWDRLAGDRYVSRGYLAVSGRVASCPPRPALTAAPPLPGEPNGAMTPAQFVAAAAGPAARSRAEYHVPASVTIAQAILESGWGKSTLAATDRNFFGLKCFSPGPIASGCRIHTTQECRGDGSCYRTEARFRVYRSVTDSFRDHGRLLATSARYRPAFAFTGNANRFVEEIHKAGYATSPSYATDLQRIMKQYDLYRYDRAT